MAKQAKSKTSITKPTSRSVTEQLTGCHCPYQVRGRLYGIRNPEVKQWIPHQSLPCLSGTK